MIHSLHSYGRYSYSAVYLISNIFRRLLPEGERTLPLLAPQTLPFGRRDRPPRRTTTSEVSILQLGKNQSKQTPTSAPLEALWECMTFIRSNPGIDNSAFWYFSIFLGGGWIPCFTWVSHKFRENLLMSFLVSGYPPKIYFRFTAKVLSCWWWPPGSNTNAAASNECSRRLGSCGCWTFLPRKVVIICCTCFFIYGWSFSSFLAPPDSVGHHPRTQNTHRPIALLFLLLLLTNDLPMTITTYYLQPASSRKQQ